MATCPTVKPLPCLLSGVGYLASSCGCPTTQLTLMSGHGANFPTLEPLEYFFVSIVSPCNTCCTEVKVTALVGDVLTVEGLGSSPCACFPQNTRVRYEGTSPAAIKALAAEVPINVESPLSYDQCTRTLSVDWNALKQLIGTGCGGCGCGE